MKATKKWLKQPESKAVVLAVIEEIDGFGRGIWPASRFVELGMPTDVAAEFQVTHESDGGVGTDGQIRNQDYQPIKSMNGIGAYDLLTGMAGILKLKYAGAMGMGQEARNAAEALAAWAKTGDLILVG